MEKNTNSKTTTILIIALIILLIAVSIFGGWAWSKYTTSIDGNATATVAKWNFGTTTQIQNLNLTDLSQSGAVIFNDIENIATDRIAPGTSGKFTVSLDTTGTEVALKYDILLSNITNKPSNLHFYSDSSYTNQIDNEDGTSASYSGYIAQGDHGTAHNVTIYWQWPYQTGTEANDIASNDKKDTTDGQNANNVTFDLTITGTQVNPDDAQVTTTQNN